jgi:hypothetical protein
LARHGFRRLAVITPYNDDLTKAIAAAASAPRRKIVAAHGMGITVNVELAHPTPDEIVAFARARLGGAKFDGVFVSCTNLPGPLNYAAAFLVCDCSRHCWSSCRCSEPRSARAVTPSSRWRRGSMLAVALTL